MAVSEEKKNYEKTISFFTLYGKESCSSSLINPDFGFEYSW
jgi:hypothetical protein